MVTQGFAVIHVESACEAAEALAGPEGGGFDGLLANHSLSDALAYRVVAEFLSQYPGRPAAIMTSSESLFLNLWAERRKVEVLHKPFATQRLAYWCRQARAAAQNLTPTAACAPRRAPLAAMLQV